MHMENRNRKWLEQTDFQILREKCDGNFIFKENLLIILPNPVELSHEWVKTNFKYQEPEFYYVYFDE